MLTIDWIKFAEEIKFHNRFFPETYGILRFVDQIFGKKIVTLEKGTKFYRARLIGIEDIEEPEEALQGFPKKDSMSPDAKIATAQRASPANIPYLYIAEDKYTALSEIRPGILSFISLVEIVALKNLNLFDLWIDLSNINDWSDFYQLASRFSSVISEKEKEIDYLPRQFIAEYIKHKGVDGIRYASFQSQTGKNIVLFDEEKVSFIQSEILQTRNVVYSFLDLNSPDSKSLIGNLEPITLPEDYIECIKETVRKIQIPKKKTPSSNVVG